MLFTPCEEKDMLNFSLQSFLLAGLCFFALRLFQFCDMRHLALSLIPAGFIAFGLIFWRDHHLDTDAAGITLALMGAILFAGAVGMSLGECLCRRSESFTRKTVIRVTILTLAMCFLFGPSLYHNAVAQVTAHQADVMAPSQLKANVNDLKRTVIVPTLEAPLSGGTNVIWCGTMQLAWNELCALTGEDVHMENEDPAVGQLNRRAVTTEDLDERTFIATAVLADAASLSDLRKRVAAKYNGLVTPELIPSADTLPQNSVLVYSSLFVNMPFQWAFDRLKRPLRFGADDVTAFGIDDDLGDRERLVRSQVKVFDFRDSDNFVVELKTKRARHQLILAKLPPEATLEGTVRSALTRMTAPPNQSPSWFNHLIVPIADYDLVRRYPELVGRPLRVQNPSFANQPIIAANQSIRFKLDERGAVLKSESSYTVAAKYAEQPPDLIFDKPFLVLLKCANSDKPYFAMWVDNTEVLVPFLGKASVSKL
jgi:hypothetical protein